MTTFSVTENTEVEYAQVKCDTKGGALVIFFLKTSLQNLAYIGQNENMYEDNQTEQVC